MAYQECVNGHVDIWLDMDDKPEGHYISYVDHEFENGEYADYTAYYNEYRGRFNTRVNYNDSKVDPTLQYWCDRAQAVFNQRVFPGMPDNFVDTAEYEKYLETRKECFEECSLAYNLDNGVQGKILSAGPYSPSNARQLDGPDDSGPTSGQNKRMAKLKTFPKSPKFQSANGQSKLHLN